MDLKHLIIAAIVGTPPKAAWFADDRQNCHPQPTQPIRDVRPSDGLFNERKASKAVNNSEIKPLSHDAQPAPLDGCGNS
jgi:hypothetical protein